VPRGAARSLSAARWVRAVRSLLAACRCFHGWRRLLVFDVRHVDLVKCCCCSRSLLFFLLLVTTLRFLSASFWRFRSASFFFSRFARSCSLHRFSLPLIEQFESLSGLLFRCNGCNADNGKPFLCFPSFEGKKSLIFGWAL